MRRTGPSAWQRAHQTGPHRALPRPAPQPARRTGHQLQQVPHLSEGHARCLVRQCINMCLGEE